MSKKMLLEIDQDLAPELINTLLREIDILNDFLEDAEFGLQHKDKLLAEKAEIIKKLSENVPRNKVTTVKRGPGRPKKRGPGRPKKVVKQGVSR